MGAGETFDQPELWEWLLALNARDLNVRVLLCWALRRAGHEAEAEDAVGLERVEFWANGRMVGERRGEPLIFTDRH